MGAGFCTLCGIEVQSFEGLTACPSCNTKSYPCDHADDVNVKINWQELRVLVMWAERWGVLHKDDQHGATNPDLIYSIAERLEKQHEARAASSPLTLAGDLGKLRDKYPGQIKTTFPGVEGASIEPS